MRKDPVIYLNHIQDCIVKIITYTDGLDEQGFLNSTIVQDAVVRNFEIIGEATKQLVDSSDKRNTPFIFECVVENFVRGSVPESLPGSLV